MNAPVPDDALASRLPLPLAQLYRRAHNAKEVRERHNAAYYLWETGLKLLGSAAVVAYAERNHTDPALTDCLQKLARPALGEQRVIYDLLRAEAERLLKGAGR